MFFFPSNNYCSVASAALERADKMNEAGFKLATDRLQNDSANCSATAGKKKKR